MFSFGNRSRSALTTVSPPMPESKTPIGRESLMQPGTWRRSTLPATPIVSRSHETHLLNARARHEIGLSLCNSQMHHRDVADKPNSLVPPGKRYLSLRLLFLFGIGLLACDFSSERLRAEQTPVPSAATVSQATNVISPTPSPT